MARGRALGAGIALAAAIAALVVAGAGAPDNPSTSAVDGSGPTTIEGAGTTIPETPAAIELIGSTAGVHDPMAARADGFWLFSTGPGISVRHADDLSHWERTAPVFASDATPEWWARTVLGYRGRDVWAPDVSWFGGQWHLYYSISVFGQQTAAIGHATNATLDPAEPSFGWVDHGPVVVSAEGDEWVAIDANVALDDSGDPWLAWASRSKLTPFVKLARTIRAFRVSILATIEWGYTNGIAESNNACIGRIRANARGFHDPEAFIKMIMLDRAGLTPALPWAA